MALRGVAVRADVGVRFGLLTYALRHVEVGSRVGGVDRPVECLRDGVIRYG